MAEIRPFRGVHYNQELLKHWEDIICPVYDIISPQQQIELHKRNDRNFVRLEFGLELPRDTDTDNKYTRAAATLEEWLKQGVMTADKSPAIYIHDHYFTHGGKEYKRRGLIVRVRVEDWDKMIIRPHEGTMTKPKADRLNLLGTLQANTSSILALYEDSSKQIASLLSTRAQSKPHLNLKRTDGEGHQIWALTDPTSVGQIQKHLAQQPLYIADGHHRYESALNYQRQRLADSPSASREEGFNFVMMTLLEFADPGLILPPHRLVRGIGKETLDGLMPKLKGLFEVEDIPLNAPDVWDQVDRRLGKTDGVRLALCGLEAERVFLLKLRDQAAVNPMMPSFHSEIYKSLDVSVLDHVILERFLGLRENKEGQFLGFTYDRQDAVNRVLAQEYQLAFIIRPIKAETIKAIADVRDRMPKKSTYFYPKPPSGLIINRLI